MIDFETGNAKFGEVLAELIRLKRLSQTEVALKANISQSAVSKLISGKRALTFAAAERLGSALNINSEDLLRAQTEIVEGATKPVAGFIVDIIGTPATIATLAASVGTPVSRLHQKDILRIFDPENEGMFEHQGDPEPCEIYPFNPDNVKLTSYDTRAGCIGIPPLQRDKWWTGVPVNGPISIPPHSFVHVGTAEHITLPSWLEGFLHPASNITRKPLIVLHGPIIDPGFSSNLYVTVYNPTGQEQEIEPDEPFMTLWFNLRLS